MATKRKSISKRKSSARALHSETDSSYLLKLVLFMVIGSLWIKVTTNDGQLPIPVGFIIGMIFAMHDHFQIDRKIEFALLLVAMLIGFWLPIGIFVSA